MPILTPYPFIIIPYPFILTHILVPLPDYATTFLSFFFTHTQAWEAGDTSQGMVELLLPYCINKIYNYFQ